MVTRRSLHLICVWMLVAGCAGQRRASLESHAHPLVVVSEWADRWSFGWDMRRLLVARKFDKLEAFEQSIRVNARRYDSGTPQLVAFYASGFGTVDQPEDAEQWQVHLERLREWMDTRPESDAAHIALANALIGRAWAARGHGYASTVSVGKWRRFEDDLTEAGSILRQCRVSAHESPAWYEAMLAVLHGSGSDQDSAYRDLQREAVTRFPTYVPFYTHMARHLLPRWYGAPGEWEQYAATCADALPDSIGDEMYARIVASQCEWMQSVFAESEGLSWERARRGLEAWRRRFPKSVVPLNAMARLACEAGRAGDALRAFERIGDTCEVEVWRDTTRFIRARAWAERQGSRPS